MPKGEKVWAQSKRTAPPPNLKIKFSIWYLIVFKKGEKVVSSKIAKPSWTLRGEFYLGGVFVLVKGKAFETGGENFKSWKCLISILFMYLWLFAKCFEKNFTRICKTKPVVQMWSKILIKKKTIHAHLLR
jgi:hypothetical protein